MASNKLSARFCETASVGNYFDGEGMYLHVTKDNKKYWRMQAYLDGKKILLALGTYTKVSLAEARKARQEAQELIKQGIHPTEYKKKLKAEQIARAKNKNLDNEKTFKQIAIRLYMSKEGKVTDDSRNRMLRQLEIHVFPVIGDREIEGITGKELLELFREVSKKTNKEGNPMTYMARKLCQWVSEVYNLAGVEDDKAPRNPCPGILNYLPKHETTNMARIDLEDLPDFIKALDQYRGYQLTKAAIWMMLYTGVRQISIRRALRKDFDLEKAIWHRQPEKSDKSIHDLPLPKQAISLLQNMDDLTGQTPESLAFPSVYKNYDFMSELAVSQAIKRMGFKMAGHGLRGLVSTGLNERGYDRSVVEIQLGHREHSSVEAAYNKAKHFERRAKMMQEWADYLDSLRCASAQEENADEK